MAENVFIGITNSNVYIDVDSHDDSHDEQEQHVCARCGAVTDEDDVVIVVDMNGHEVEWCGECADGHSDECEHCGRRSEVTEYVNIGDWWRGRSSEQWCPSCIDEDARHCDCCDELYENNSLDEYRTYDGDWVTLCGDCRSDEYYSCEDCGDLVPRSEAVYFERNDCYYCPNCAENHSDHLFGYEHTDGNTFWFDDESHKYSWTMSSEERKLLFLGLELETSDNDNPCRLANDIAYYYDDDKLVCKEDGSLGSSGVEIVSQPMTPNFHLRSGMWERVTELVRAHSGLSHDSGRCGLHIHVSYDFFKDYDAVYRLDRLFHRFSEQLVNFSRRKPSMMHWCVISDDSELDDIESAEERKDVWKDKKDCASRYEAVNVTNDETVEIRLWRGTLNMTTLRATIEMTAGLAIVANSMTDELAETLTWPMLKLLVRFALEQNGIDRSSLDEYLKIRSL